MDRPFFFNRVDAGRRLADALSDTTDPRTIVLGVPRGGVPVASPEAARELRDITDHWVGLYTGPLNTVGEFYEDFTQVDDQQVLEILRAFPYS